MLAPAYVQTSEDGVSWSSPLRRVNPTAPNCRQQLPTCWSTAVNWWDDSAHLMGGTTARFVRFTVLRRLNIWGVKIYEIQICMPAGIEPLP